MTKSGGVYYSRDHLRNEQRTALQRLDDAQRNEDSAKRLIAGGLIREAAEELALASFHIDRADICLEGHANRISSLKSSPFAYARGEEQRKLSASVAEISQRMRDCQERITALHKSCGATNPQAASLNIYLVKRHDYRTRIRDGLTEGSVVVSELRQLAVFPFALVRSGIITKENVALCHLNPDGSVRLPTGETVLPDGKAQPNTDNKALTALKQETIDLRQKMEELRRAQAAGSRPAPAPVTNVTVVVVASAGTTNAATQAPAAIPQNAELMPSSPAKAGQSVVTTPFISNTNSTPAPEPMALPTNRTAFATTSVPAHTNTEALATANSTKPTDSPPHSAIQSRFPLALALIASAVTITLAATCFMWLAALRGRLYTLSFTTDRGETRTEELTALEEVLLLGASISREHVSVVDPSARIRVSWRGPVLQPGTITPVLINDVPVQRTRRLHSNDQITIATESGEPKKMTFLTCEPAGVAMPAESVTTE